MGTKWNANPLIYVLLCALHRMYAMQLFHRVRVAVETRLHSVDMCAHACIQSAKPLFARLTRAHSICKINSVLTYTFFVCSVFSFRFGEQQTTAIEYRAHNLCISSRIAERKKWLKMGYIGLHHRCDAVQHSYIQNAVGHCMSYNQTYTQHTLKQRFTHFQPFQPVGRIQFYSNYFKSPIKKINFFAL